MAQGRAGRRQTRKGNDFVMQRQSPSLARCAEGNPLSTDEVVDVLAPVTDALEAIGKAFLGQRMYLLGGRRHWPGEAWQAETQGRRCLPCLTSTGAWAKGLRHQKIGSSQ